MELTETADSLKRATVWCDRRRKKEAVCESIKIPCDDTNDWQSVSSPGNINCRDTVQEGGPKVARRGWWWQDGGTG